LAGSIADSIESNCVSLSGVGFLVLDEAARMQDIGFEGQIRRIIAAIPSARQTAKFSAAWRKVEGGGSFGSGFDNSGDRIESWIEKGGC
jgi:superfamily II DNA/RNA helicase